MVSLALSLHPLTESGALPVPPVFLAVLTVLVVLLAAVPTPRAAHNPHDPDRYLAEPVAAGGWTGRGVVLLVVGLAIVASRVGAAGPTRNIAPALVLGVGWPLLVLACASVPGLWAHLDPWDGLARGLERIRVAVPDRIDPPSDVRWALPLALGFTWYLSAYRGAVQPRAVGTALGVYGLLTVVSCLALGRRAWLARGEPVGLFLRWLGLLPRRALGAWKPPIGAGALLGLLAGGLLFGALRLSDWWARFAFAYQGQRLDTAGFALTALVGAALLAGLSTHARRSGVEGAVAAAAVPVVAGIALAMSMIGGRLLNAARLLVPLASDPLGHGWDLFGTARWSPGPYPVSPGWHVVIQLTVLTVGAVLGARVARGRSATSDAPAAVLPAVAGVCVLLAGAVLAITML